MSNELFTRLLITLYLVPFLIFRTFCIIVLRNPPLASRFPWTLAPSFTPFHHISRPKACYCVKTPCHLNASSHFPLFISDLYFATLCFDRVEAWTEALISNTKTRVQGRELLKLNCSFSPSGWKQLQQLLLWDEILSAVDMTQSARAASVLFFF